MRVNGHALRRLARFGAQRMPLWFVRRSPDVFAFVFAILLRKPRRQVNATWHWIRGRSSWPEVHSTFCEFAHCLTESLAQGRVSAEIQVEGKESLTTALAAGRGVIVATAHTGAWDVSAGKLAQTLGVPVTLVMAAEPDEKARRLHDDIRAQMGIQIRHVGASIGDALPLIDDLLAGHAVAMQIDRGAASGRVVRAELFKRQFAVPEGVFKLAQLTGAPILPVFCRRLGFFRYHVRVFPPIWLARTVSSDELDLAARTLLHNLEQFVQLDPRQWFYFSDPPEPHANPRRPN